MDWTFFVMVASLVGTIANIKKRAWCFIIWAATNCIWAVVDFGKGLKWQGLQFAIYACLALWGIIEWRKKSGSKI